MVVYAAVVLAFVVLARRHSSRLLFWATYAGIAVLMVYALAHYLFGPRTYVPFEGYLLSDPLGYANAAGILGAMGVLLSTGAAADSTSKWVRVAAAATVPLLALAVELSGSRASWLALAIGLAATTALHRSPRSLMRSLAAVAAPTALAVWAGHYSRLGTLDSVSSPQLSGKFLALAALGCAVVSGAVASRLPPPNSRSSPHKRRLAFASAVIVALVGVVAVASAGVTEPRSLYYHVAWREYLGHPLLGSGAGTFARYWLHWGDVGTWGGALDAHSLYLETLAELGPIGLCLLVGFLLYPLRRTIEHRSLPFVPAAAGASIAFLVHAGLDWDWEVPAVVVAGLACAAVVAFAEPEESEDEPSRTLPGAVRFAALAAALLAGAAAIAGARSSTEPSAAPLTTEAPHSGASSRTSI
jgi:O-antigen ligase